MAILAAASQLEPPPVRPYAGITNSETARQGRTDSPMDQIIDHSTIEKRSGLRARRPASRTWIVGATAALFLLLVYLGSSYYKSDQAVAPQVAVPSVTVSRPLQRDVDTRRGFLGQFSAIDRVELRAQVGGTLTEIHFQDGQIIHKGDLLFVIDPRPYEIRLAQASAQLQTATARVALANSQLARAQSLRHNDFGTQETVDQRINERDAAEAAIEDAKARIRDARLPRILPRHGTVHRANRRPPGLDRQPGRRQPGGRQPDNPAGDARLARSDLSRFRHERVGLSDLFTGTRPPSRSARGQGRHRP